ncbi:hypothetical protein ABPG75_013999 [Micractinium tetrahymenae]
MAALQDAWRAVARSFWGSAGGAAAAAALAPQRSGRRYPTRLGLEASLPLPVDSFWGALLRLGMDPRFLLGLVIGWKVVAELLKGRRTGAGTPNKDKCAAKELAQLQQRVEELQGELAAARAAAADAQSLLRDAEDRCWRHERAALALQAEVARLEGQVAELQAALSSAVAQVEVDGAAVAAKNARLVQQNQAALQQLRALTEALEEQRAAGAAGHAVHAAPGHAELAELLEDNEQLRHALDEVRAQLDKVMHENAELADRLLRVAFEPVAPHEAEGGTPITSPVRRSRALSADEGLQRRASVAQQKLELVAEVARCGSAASNHSAAAGAAGTPGVAEAADHAAAAPAPGAAAPAAAGGAAELPDADLEATLENDSSVHNGTASPAASVKSFPGSDLGRVSVSSEVSWAS